MGKVQKYLMDYRDKLNLIFESLTDEEAERIIELYLSGHSLTYIIKELGINRWHVRNTIKNAGIMRSRREASDLKWEDPEYRKGQTEKANKQWEDPEFREKRSREVKTQWEDPEFRQQQIDRGIAQWEDPELRREKSLEVKKQWEDPEHKEKMSNIHKELWKDKDFWEWISKFPEEKQRKILNAMYSKRKNYRGPRP